MAQDMTPRERVYAAINHQEPDRVPTSFGGCGATSIAECPPNGRACSRLYEYLGITDAEPVQISDIWNMVSNMDERVKLGFHSDMRNVFANAPPAIVEPDGSKTWPFLCGMRLKKVGLYDEPFEWPMRYMTTKEDIDNYPWPDTTAVIMEGVVEKARHLHEETDYFVLGDTLSQILPITAYTYLAGMSKWLMDMKLRPKFYHQLAGRIMEVGTAFNEQFFEGVGQYLDGAMISDDLGMQTGPLMSLADFREFYKPYMAENIKLFRRYMRPEAKIFLHCCGSIHPLIPELIEIGVDVLNPVQPLARNMEPWRLKRDFGEQITFLGGFDIQSLLPLGTLAQIREGVKKLIAEYAPGGGFIFAASHNIEPDTPPENIVAMYDAVYEYGRYPIPKATGLNFVDYIKSLNLH